MDKDKTSFLVRTDKSTADKIKYVAEYYGRNRQRHVEWMCKQAIKEFEKEHGKITFDNQQDQ